MVARGAGAANKFIHRNSSESARACMAHETLRNVKTEIDPAKVEDELLGVKILAEVAHCDGQDHELTQMSTPPNSLL